MKDVMGVIYTGESDTRLRELTKERAIAALPVAGRYRVIDFLVSSMVNGGIKNVGIITQKNYQSLMDHMGSGKEWDLHGKNNGLHVLPPFLTRDNVGVYSGALDALRSNANYLSRSTQEYVILSGSEIIYNADFDALARTHAASGADVTMLYSTNAGLARPEYGSYLTIDQAGNVTDIEVDPSEPSTANVALEVFVMKREAMRDLVDKGVAHGYHDFTKDVVLSGIHEGSLKVAAVEYTGPCWRIDSVQAYFNFSMDVLKPDVRHDLFAHPVYTKVRDEMPARYGTEGKVVNSLVADGCVIEGTVENSILFRGVRVAPGAHIKNCVVMQDGQVHANAEIENCILDKQAVIKRNARLIGPAAYPIVIAKNVVI